MGSSKSIQASQGRVSVVIPSYNYGRFLRQTIGSLQEQDFQNWEAIIVDDGSTDDTEEVVAALLKLDSRVIYVPQQNAGTSAAKNTGIRHAQGDYIIFLDADDLLTPNKLTAHVEHLTNHPHIDISYSRFRYFQDGFVERLFSRLDLSSEEEWSAVINGDYAQALPVFLRKNNMVIHAAMMRRSFVERVGYFDTSMHALEDWDYWLRCILRGGYVAFLDDPQALALTRVHKDSATHTRDFSDYKDRVYENVRGEAFRLRMEGNERLYALVEKELRRLAKRKKRRMFREQRAAIQWRIRAAGFFNVRELANIAEQFGSVNCLRAYWGALIQYLFVRA